MPPLGQAGGDWLIFSGACTLENGEPQPWRFPLHRATLTAEHGLLGMQRVCLRGFLGRWIVDNDVTINHDMVGYCCRAGGSAGHGGWQCANKQVGTSNLQMLINTYGVIKSGVSHTVDLLPVYADILSFIIGVRPFWGAF